MDAKVVLERYLKTVEESGKSPLTTKSYKKELGRFFSFFKFQEIEEIAKVSKDEFRSFIYSLESLSNNSKNGTIRSISAFITFLLDDEIIKEENISGTKFGKSRYLKVEKKTPVSLTVEEIDKVIAAGANLQDKFMFELILGTGLREAEVASLKPSDFKEDGTFVVIGKGGSQYVLSMSDRLNQLKAMYMSQRDESREYLFYPTIGRGYKNEKISPQTVNVRLKAALSRTDIPVERQKQLSAHKLRATLITWIIKNHGIEAARQAARHSNINTTQIYNNARELGNEAMRNVRYR